MDKDERDLMSLVGTVGIRITSVLVLPLTSMIAIHSFSMWVG